VNFVFNSNATVKEAQALARHATPELTMNVYDRRRGEPLSPLGILAEPVYSRAYI
jgi:hypothetical protein